MGCCGWVGVNATPVTGVVRDDKGNPLPYASVWVKGGTRGVTANSEGHFSIDLSAGDHVLVCQYVGYTRQERKVVVGAEPVKVDFVLSSQQLSMAEVVVRPGGEDPAYAIIRKAIRRRKDYADPLDSFTCEAYIKTLMKLRRLPKRVLGQKIEEKDKREMGVDSTGKGIIYLSESLTKVAYKRPDKLKLEVLSGRESGSNGYGFSFPIFINFYENNVTVLTDRLNPRGFVSPIADGALNFYRYKFLGSFFEDGKEVNKIQVTPRRKYEPLFSGTIEITEGDWRIHGLDLMLSKQSQLELMDTLEIKQIHAPVGGGGAPVGGGGVSRGGASEGGPGGGGPAGGEVWQVKNQVVYFTFNFLGIDAVGNFVDVYNNYDVAPKWKRKFFDRVLMKYDTAVNKKTKAYWDSIRPVPLEPDEKVNYIIRDSIYAASRDSVKKSESRWKLTHGPWWEAVGYNTVEGIDVNLWGTVSKKVGGSVLRLTPHVRYGFHNTRLNVWGTFSWERRGLEDEGPVRQTWSLSGGKRISQFNPDDPIREIWNSIYTLLWGRNYMKVYQNYFTEAGWATVLDNGLRLRASALYEDRIPLDNTTLYTWAKSSSTKFTPNYPVEKLSANFTRHQAVITTVGLTYQPGQRYIEFPHRKEAIGSKYPVFSLVYQKGWDGVLGSDVNFDKWRFTVSDDMNFRLAGRLSYRLGMGGFLNTNSVPIQDYQHFNGNQLVLASEYLNSWQLAPYYSNSTTASFYATGHVEHHFNGFLTNKIPPFRQLNIFLVGGANAFYVNSGNNYVEVFGGLENILKVFRVDVVSSWMGGHYYQTGVRVGLGGLLSWKQASGGR